MQDFNCYNLVFSSSATVYRPIPNKLITEESEFSFDPSGESITYNTIFLFESLDHFRVACTKYKKELKNKHNWEDSLQILITTTEVAEWFNNPL